MSTSGIKNKFLEFKIHVITNQYYLFFSQAGNESLIIILNFGNESNTVDVTNVFSVPTNLTVVTASIESEYNEG